VSLGRPDQGIPLQQARTRAPGVNGGSDSLAAVTAIADVIVVETVDDAGLRCCRMDATWLKTA